jgi:hypothetical protein
MPQQKEGKTTKTRKTTKFIKDLYYIGLVAFAASMLAVFLALMAFICPPTSFNLSFLQGPCYLRPFPTSFLPELLVLDSLLMPAVSSLHTGARKSFDFLPKYLALTPPSVWRKAVDASIPEGFTFKEWLREPEKARRFFLHLPFAARACSMIVFFVAALLAMLGLAYTDPLLISYAIRFSLTLTVGGFFFTIVYLFLFNRRVSSEMIETQPLGDY